MLKKTLSDMEPIELRYQRLAWGGQHGQPLYRKQGIWGPRCGNAVHSFFVIFEPHQYPQISITNGDLSHLFHCHGDQRRFPGRHGLNLNTFR